MRSRIKRRARTIPLKGHNERGNGLDDGVWFRCWNCGFINSTDRNSLGGPESRDGVTVTDFAVPVHGAETGTPYSGVARLGGSLGATVAPEVDAAGDPKQSEGHFKPVVSGGCSFCGTLNWKGDYP